MNTYDTEDNNSDLEVQPRIHNTRRELALIITGLVVIVALVAVYQNGAMTVLDKVLPMLTLAFGFFFGQQTAKL